MRVIAGLYKRRVLIAPQGIEITRPTSDRVKENLFNILAAEIDESYFLDLFSGSGSIGIEALSRGAKHVTFVENNKLALSALHKNIEQLKISDAQYTVIHKSVDDFLKSKNLSNQRFDIIFSDPPYTSTWYKNALENIDNSGLCQQECLVILEKPAKHQKDRHITSVSMIPQNWTLQDTRKYGKTELEFWRRHYD